MVYITISVEYHMNLTLNTVETLRKVKQLYGVQIVVYIAVTVEYPMNITLFKGERRDSARVSLEQRYR